MYHIKDDKRMVTSAKMIVDGLAELLLTHKMTDLSVTDLSEAAGVSRSTFYRLFDTPIDVLDYACDVIASKIIKDYKANTFEDKDDFVLFSFKYWAKNYHVLEAMFNCGRLDLVQHALEKYSEVLVPEAEQFFTPVELEYLRSAAVGAIGGLLRVWLRHNKKESPEELFELYKKIVRTTQLDFLKS